MNTPSFASRVLRAICALALFAGALAAHAAFPEKAVKLVVAGPPAGGTDFLARLVADELGQVWKQPVVVENRAGASGLIGTRFVQTAPPDGYTLILGHAATHAIVPALHQPAPYDPIANFTPISLVATAPDLLVVAADSPIRSVADLIARAKAKPGSVTYGSPGIGLPQHLLGHRLAQLAGVSMLHVPYKGSSPALTELMGGQLASMFVTSGAVMPFIKPGRVRAIAVNSARRVPDLPDVPTFAELGMPQLQQAGWFGVFGPAGVAPDVVAAINAAIAKVLAMPQVRAKMAAQYFEPVGGSAEQFAAFHREEVKRWAAIVRESGVRPD
jgi:tripartite-type tricarboxylate transporter receptor subunit TctC